MTRRARSEDAESAEIKIVFFSALFASTLRVLRVPIAR
jgi:hypothetical protein